MQSANDDMIEKIISGDLGTLARVVTLVENNDPRILKLMNQIYMYTGKAHIVGIAGPAGVGKSCLVSKLITEYKKRGKKVGVIAVDPTSPFTGGAVLADRARMKEHSLDKDVFIRSMSTRGGFGGLPKTIGGVIDVLDASGKDVVIVETIGVGQNQFDIVNYVYTLIVVFMPKMGDELQTMKSGLHEIGDIFVVNKADQENAEKTVKILEEMLEAKRLEEILRKAKIGWRKPVLKTVATTGEGIPQLVDVIEKHREYLISSGKVDKVKERKSETEVLDLIFTKLQNYVNNNIARTTWFKNMVQEISKGRLDPFSVADQVIKKVLSTTV